VEDFADEDENHGEKEDEKEDDKSPRVTRAHVAHSFGRRSAYVTDICARVADTAAVDVLLLSSHSTQQRGNATRQPTPTGSLKPITDAF